MFTSIPGDRAQIPTLASPSIRERVKKLHEILSRLNAGSSNNVHVDGERAVTSGRNEAQHGEYGEDAVQSISPISAKRVKVGHSY